MGLSASSVAELSSEELKSAKCQLLFGSAEKIVKCLERQLFFDSPTFGSNCNR